MLTYTWRQWLDGFLVSCPVGRGRRGRRGFQPRLVQLEDRTVPTVFSNATAITINDRVFGDPPGMATPYPSNITVSGLTGTISHLTVKLSGVSHTFADDIDVLLVGPGGQKFVVVSDAGGSAAPMTNVTVTFDDTAGSTIQDETGNWGANNSTVTSKP